MYGCNRRQHCSTHSQPVTRTLTHSHTHTLTHTHTHTHTHTRSVCIISIFVTDVYAIVNTIYIVSQVQNIFFYAQVIDCIIPTPMAALLVQYMRWLSHAAGVSINVIDYTQ